MQLSNSAAVPPKPFPDFKTGEEAAKYFSAIDAPKMQSVKSYFQKKVSSLKRTHTAYVEAGDTRNAKTAKADLDRAHQHWKSIYAVWDQSRKQKQAQQGELKGDSDKRERERDNGFVADVEEYLSSDS